MESLGIQRNYQLRQLICCSCPDRVSSQRRCLNRALRWCIFLVLNVLQTGLLMPNTAVKALENSKRQLFHHLMSQFWRRFQLNRGDKSARSRVKAQLETVAAVATQEWYRMHENFLVGSPSISRIIAYDHCKFGIA